MTVPARIVARTGPAADGPGPHAARESDRLRRVIAAQRDLACAPADAEQVFQLLARVVLDIFDADGALAAQPDGDSVVARATAGTCVPPVGSAIPREGTLAGLALRTLEPLLCRDGDTDPRTRQDINSIARTRSSLVVPLVHDGEAIGLVSAISPVPDAFDDDDLALLCLLADAAAAALYAALLRAREETLSARSQAIIESLDEGLVEIDLTGAITFANASAQRMLGVGWDETSQSTVADSGYEYIWEDGSPRPVETLPSSVVFATGSPRQDEVLGLRDGTGRVWWLLVNAVPRLVDGRVESVITSFRDVTARRDDELQRRTSDARLHAAQSLTGLAWWSLDLATGRHEWSDAMFHLLGLVPREEPPDLDGFLELVHPDDRPVGTAGLGTGDREVFRVVHPDGSIHFLQSWNEVETDATGVAVRVVGATIDVTDREEAVSSLAVHRAKLSAALELTATATWEWDVRSDRVTWSDRMVALMGRGEDASPPGVEDFLGCVHPEDRQRMADLGRRTVETGVPEEAVYRVVHADGGDPSHPGDDGRPHGIRRHRDPSVGHGGGRDRAGGVRRPAGGEPGTLPGGVRQRADRHVADQPGP